MLASIVKQADHDVKFREAKAAERQADNPTQSKRFIEAAKKLGVDESGEAFSKAR